MNFFQRTVMFLESPDEKFLFLIMEMEWDGKNDSCKMCGHEKYKGFHHVVCPMKQMKTEVEKRICDAKGIDKITLVGYEIMTYNVFGFSNSEDELFQIAKKKSISPYIVEYDGEYNNHKNYC